MRHLLSPKHHEHLHKVGIENAHDLFIVDVNHEHYERQKESWRRTLPLASEEELHMHALASVLWKTQERGKPKPKVKKYRYHWFLLGIIILLIALLYFIWPRKAHAQIVEVQGAGKGSTASSVATVTTVDSNHNAIDVNIAAGGGTGGGPADAAANAAASESDVARQKVIAVIRLLDTGQGSGSQLVTAKGDQTSGMWVNCKSGCAGGSSTPADTFATPTTAGLNLSFPMLWNGTTFDRLYGDKTNGAFVNIKNSVSLAVTGTFWQATQPVSGTFWQATQPVSATSLPLPTGAAADSSLTTLDTDVKANITLHAGGNLVGKVGIDQTTPGTTNAVQETNLPSTVDTNSGNKSASTLRTVVATDQPNLTTPLNETPQSANGLPLGTNPNPIYVASLTPLLPQTTKSQLVGPLGQQLGTPQNPLNVQIPVSDPCAGGNKRNVPISVTANTQLVVAPPTGTVHICHLFLLSTSAETYSLVGGTGSTCGTGVEAIIGSTTAANGPSYAANGGQTDGSGMGTIAASNVPGNNVCILISGSTLIAGNLVWAY